MMIISVKRKIKSFFSHSKWFIQLKKRKKVKINSREIHLGNRKCLYIVPHADDEMFGGYETISRYSDNILLFYCGLLGSNYTDLNRNIRLQEFVKLCDINNFSYAICDRDLKNAFKKVIEEYKPDTIFLPSIIDWHNEHRLTNRYLFDYCNEGVLSFDSIDIIWYQVSVPLSPEYITWYQELSKSRLAHKFNMFREVYISQSFMPVKRFELESRYIGSCCSVYSAEPFILLSGLKWKKIIEYVYSNGLENDFDIMKSMINELFSINEKSNHFYHLIMENA